MNSSNSPSRPRSSAALVALTLGAAGALLYFAHAVFVPIALALLFSLLLSSPVEALNRRGLPRALSAILILVIFLAVIVGGVYGLLNPAQKWLAAGPRTASVIQHKIAPAAKILQRIEIVSDRAGRLTENAAGVPATPSGPAVTAPAPSNPEGVLVATRTALVGALTVVILSLFLLSAGPPVIAHMSAALADNTHAAQILLVYRAVRTEVGRYYATIALINLGLGIATFAALWALGMPNPVLWGVMAAVFNFIPYVGSAVTFLILSVVAFVSFDDIGRILAVPGSYLALATLEGQVVQPLLVGRRLELNPIIVFLAIWCGGWFWGFPGIVLAIPCLVALKVAAEHHKHGKALVEFLAPGGVKRFSPRKHAVKPSVGHPAEKRSPPDTAALDSRSR
jgi:predicted PurR-regulated permease PerM